VLHIANTSRTPRHYLIEQGQSPSGDAIQSAESGLVKKVQRKQLIFGEGLEEAIRLARRFQGLGTAPPDSEIVWADPQTHSPAAITDSVAKQYLARMVPLTTALAKLGYSQTEISQIMQVRIDTPDLFAPEQVVQNADQAAQNSDVVRNVPSGA
jgi:hypothetical protein